MAETKPLENVLDAKTEAEAILRGVTAQEVDRIKNKLKNEGPWKLHDYEYAVLPEKDRPFTFTANWYMLLFVSALVIYTLFIFAVKAVPNLYTLLLPWHLGILSLIIYYLYKDYTSYFGK